MTGYKILTHDWRAPLQGGPAVCDGVLPVTLPTVTLDRSDHDCGAGWNFCNSLVDAAKIAGFWRDGRPARCLVVEADGEVIQRATKSRTAQLTLVRLCTEAEIQDAMRALVTPWAAPEHVDGLVAEQWAWYVALGRPLSDETTVQGALRAALEARGLSDWTIKRCESKRAARDAWDAWAVWAAWDAWDARAARAARDAWDAWDARAAMAVWAAWATRAARSARAAWDARDAWAALAVYSTASHGWLKGYKRDHLTIGIHEAYQHGLGIALPTGPRELGYSMDVDG